MKWSMGGMKAAPGFYWNTARWEVVTMDGESERLPGGEEATYVRIPTVAMLLVGPVMGGLFAVFLPLVGFLMVLRELGRKGVRAARALVRGRREETVPVAVPPPVATEKAATEEAATEEWRRAA
ncbi:MAG TPA: hypothetical protein VII13_07455 [Vicinamibacteria bacterium]|jgi:hypothetical protein